MFTRIAWRIAAIPPVYDLIQRIAGVRYVRQRLIAYIDNRDINMSVLDIGGGTGILRDLWPSACRYICMDLDRRKLSYFLHKCPKAKGLLADATNMPVANGSIDTALCIGVAHHLSDGQLQQIVRESARVLKKKGKFFFVDPIWASSRKVGRLLWKYDRGAYPRKAEDLHAVIAGQYNILHRERFTILHECILCVAQKR